MSGLSPALQGLIQGGAVLGLLIGVLTYVTLLERKFAARIQNRIGPRRVGPRGLLQPIADAVKLMIKEDLVPADADRRIFNLAPIVFMVPCFMIYASIPFAPGLGVSDLNIGWTPVLTRGSCGRTSSAFEGKGQVIPEGVGPVKSVGRPFFLPSTPLWARR